MSIIHFLNVLEGDTNIIEHSNSGRVTVLDICNADSDDVYENANLREAVKSDISDSTTGNYGQKRNPENPIRYLERLGINEIFRFIISHPDMDHLDGIKDFFNDLKVYNVWDTANKKEIKKFSDYGRFNKYDWEFYKTLRDGTANNYKILKLLAKKHNPGNYWTEDNIKILAPAKKLIDNENKKNDDYNDVSYVILFTPPIPDSTRKWKILFGGDSHDDTWKYILDNFEDDVTNIDVLIAPHHGRDSDRDYKFLEILNPRITLLGNASSQHLAYDKYPDIRITNNQAGSIIIKCNEKLIFFVRNKKFVDDYRNKRGWTGGVTKDNRLDAYPLFTISPK